MNITRTLSAASGLLVLLATACGSSSSGGDSSSSSDKSGSSKPSGSGSSASGSSSGSSAAAGPLDPKMVALTAPIASCEFKDGGYSNCKALDAFVSSNDEFFKTPAADQALFDMLTGSDPKLAAIAARRYPSDASKILVDKAKAEKLFTLVEKTGNGYDVESAAVRWLANTDFDKLGLTDRVRALAKNPNVDVKQAVGYGIFSHGSIKPSKAIYETVGLLLGDADKEVRKKAAMGLSNNSGPETCELFKKAIDKADDKTDSLVWSAGSVRHCDGLQDKVISYIDKKSSDPSKVQNAFGIDYAQAVMFACRNEKSDSPIAKKGWTVALHLVDTKVPDPNTRYAALDTLVACGDADHAKKEIAILAKDKDTFVAPLAKKKLDELNKKK